MSYSRYHVTREKYEDWKAAKDRGNPYRCPDPRGRPPKDDYTKYEFSYEEQKWVLNGPQTIEQVLAIVYKHLTSAHTHKKKIISDAVEHQLSIDAVSDLEIDLIKQILGVLNWKTRVRVGSIDKKFLMIKLFQDAGEELVEDRDILISITDWKWQIRDLKAR